MRKRLTEVSSLFTVKYRFLCMISFSCVCVRGKNRTRKKEIYWGTNTNPNTHIQLFKLNSLRLV